MNVCGRTIKAEGQLFRIARIDGDKHKFLTDPEIVIAGLRKSEMRIDIFTFMQKLPETSPQYAYPMEWDNLAVLPVSTFDHWWKHQIRSEPRNRARQAEKKGVTVRQVPFDEALVRGIWEIYNECPIRQGTPFRHYGKDIETVRRMSATFLESSIFIGAFFEGKMIGFAKLVADDTWTQVNLMHIVSMVRHKDKAPTNALIAHCVRVCAERHIPYLVYQNYTYGKKRGDGLSVFKANNGFQRVDVPRYYVPLTPWGALALAMGLHRRVADRLPERLAAFMRELRTAWYRRKYQSVSEAR